MTAGELRRGGMTTRLEPQPARVLAMLVERAGEVVTRAELQQHVWSGDTFVDFERGLNYCVAQIRTALGDSASSPRFIETLPRRGYRFIAPVDAPVAEPVRSATRRRCSLLPLLTLIRRRRRAPAIDPAAPRGSSGASHPRDHWYMGPGDCRRGRGVDVRRAADRSRAALIGAARLAPSRPASSSMARRSRSPPRPARCGLPWRCSTTTRSARTTTSSRRR